MNITNDSSVSAIDITQRETKLVDIEKVFAKNFIMASENPALAYQKACQIKEILSDFYK